MVDPVTFQRLHTAALSAQKRAYAPYSNFHVGAAILTSTGRIITGCNVENASYGLCNCAERVAIGRMVSEGAGAPMVCLVVGPTPEPLTPCGACRQVLREFNRNMIILCVSNDGRCEAHTVESLLPKSFGPEALIE